MICEHNTITNCLVEGGKTKNYKTRKGYVVIVCLDCGAIQAVFKEDNQ